RVIDHGDNASVIEPGGADDADYTDNAAFAVPIRCDDGRRAGEREQLVFRTNENAYPVSSLRSPEQVDHPAFGFQRIKERPHTFQVFERTKVFQQIGVTADDQLTVFAVAAGPAGEAGRNNFLGQLVEFRLSFRHRFLDLTAQLRQGLAPDTSVEKI